MKATKGGRQQCLNTKCLETKGAHPKVTKRRVNQRGKEGKQPTRGYLESNQGGKALGGRFLRDLGCF